MSPLTTSGPAKKLGGFQQQDLIAALCDLGMFGVAEVRTATTTTATATTEIAAVTAATKTTPSLFLRHVGYFSATKLLTIKIDG